MIDTNEKSLRTFDVGDMIMRQGEFGESAYIIESGKVEIIIEQPNGDVLNVGTRGSGSMIGEMSLIDNAPRTATIKAIETCKVLEITKQDLTRRLDNSDPVLRTAMQVILTRYRDTLMRANISDNNKSGDIAETTEHAYLEQTDIMERVRIANEFKEALSANEIKLHYQPIINLQTGEIFGFEALMRWFHPEQGFISPGVFIPIIEDNGEILQASQWAFKESCSALKRIQTTTNSSHNFHMSVNFSSEDFSSNDFLKNINNTISETNVKPQQIHLEITERLLMTQPEKAKETLSQCREAGMGISIDDFGTGYSSLSYLHSFPVNTLKIDQSFVRDMHQNKSSLELVRSIIFLGKNMNMSIIAEGVEHREEALLLKEMGCENCQGFYFAKPMSEEDAIDLVKNWKNPGI